MEYVRLRIASERNASHFSSQLLEVDAAIEVVDVNDREELITEKKSAATKQNDIETFVSEYKGKRATINEAKQGKNEPKTSAGSSSGSKAKTL